ncbi:hypothetical protein BH10ACT8_BH10ACT8_28120 [soil metagenome]
MSARPLTDELNTVLRGHALQAPAPAATIEAILARTTRSDDALSATTQSAGVSAGERARRHRWRPSRTLLGVAAAAVLVLAAGLGINAARSPSSTSASSGTAMSDAKAAAGAPGAGSGVQVPGVQVPGVQVPGAEIPGTSGVRTGAESAVVPATCATPSERAVTSSLGRLRAPLAPNPLLQVVLTQCLDAHGDVAASQLDVQAASSSGPSVVHTLIDQRQAVHVTGATAAGTTVTAAGYSAARGGSYSYRFVVSSDGATFSAAEPVLVAATCRSADLVLSAKPGQAGARTALLQLRNTSTMSCALQGYPTVTARAAGNDSPSAFRFASGPIGAGGNPVVVLSSGAVATSLVDGAAAGAAGSCVSADQLSVAVPQLGVTGVVAVNLRGCAVQVHPFIAGQTGSG